VESDNQKLALCATLSDALDITKVGSESALFEQVNPVCSSIDKYKAFQKGIIFNYS